MSGQRQDLRLSDSRIGKLFRHGLTVQQRHGHNVLETHLSLHRPQRPVFEAALQLDPFRGLHPDTFHIGGRKPMPLPQLQNRIDGGVGARTAGIGLDVHVTAEEPGSKPLRNQRKVGLIRGGFAETAVGRFQDLRRSPETHPGQQGGHDAALSGTSRMESLAHRPVRGEGPQPRRLRPRHPQRTRHPLPVQSEEISGSGRGPERSGRSRQMPPL